MAELHELKNYGALEVTNLPSISPDRFFQIVLCIGLACDHTKFRISSVLSRLFSETLLKENSAARAGQWRTGDQQ